MANYGFFVANTGSTLYSGFTFVDSQSNNITINIPPSQTFYISADDSVTGTTYVGLDVQVQGTLDLSYDFSACCSVNSFSVEIPNSLSGFSGASYYVYYAAFTNSTIVGYGCHNIIDGGDAALYPYVTALQMDFAIPTSFTDCTDCTNTYPCNIDECCLLMGIEYSAGYYYRSLSSEGIINGRQFYIFENFSGDSIVMYWDTNDWELDNLTTSTPRGAGALTTGYCPSFSSTTIDASPGLSDLTGATLNLFANLISCSGCSPIFCVKDTGLGYDDTFISAGTYNGDTYWSGLTNGDFIYFTTGGTWCLSSVLDGTCLLEGSYPCSSTCPDLCDTYVFSGNCPTPTPTPTVNCSVLDFTAVFDCEVTPTPSVTPTISTTPTMTPTPSPSDPCGGRALDVTITGYTPTPTPTISVTPTMTPEVTRPCNISGTVTFNPVIGILECPLSKKFVDCSNGSLYYAVNPIILPSGGTLTQSDIFKANINGVSKCVVFLGIELDVIGVDQIDLVDGPLGSITGLSSCDSVCTPDITPTPTVTPTPSITPTLTPTPTSSPAVGYYLYQRCSDPTQYIIQTLPGPTYTPNQVFSLSSSPYNGQCWKFISYSTTYPTLPLGSTSTYLLGNSYPTSGITFFENCSVCISTIGDTGKGGTLIDGGF